MEGSKMDHFQHLPRIQGQKRRERKLRGENPPLQVATGCQISSAAVLSYQLSVQYIRYTVNLFNKLNLNIGTLEVNFPIINLLPLLFKHTGQNMQWYQGQAGHSPSQQYLSSSQI